MDSSDDDSIEFDEEHFPEAPPKHNCIFPWNKDHCGVTTLYKCNATKAKGLYIFDSAYKLQEGDQYDIGGAHTENDEGLWFFFTTSVGPGRIYLINIFVCQRKPGTFSLGISDSNTLTTTTYNSCSVRTLSNELYLKTLQSTQANEIKYIKTFQFSEEDRVSLIDKVLVIPISITLSPKNVLNNEVVQKIKDVSDFGYNLFKDQEPDFIVKSSEGKEYRVHKVVLAAHSPKLRDLIRAEECKTICLDISNFEVEQLLQYSYTGVIKDISYQQIEGLLMLVDKFQLDNLKLLVCRVMNLSLTFENALSTAVIAEKYNNIDLQEVAFKYIAQHPALLETKAFSELDNANLTNKLLQYISKAS